MADFNPIINKVFEREGGFVNDPIDRGGPTNLGISWPTWQKTSQKYLGLDPTLENLKSLTKDNARKIYKGEFWEPIKGDQIEDQEVADFIFDFNLNSGKARPAIQESLKNVGNDIKADGIFGDNTIKAINNTPKDKLMPELIDKRLAYVENDVKNHPKQKKYLKGWNNRICSFSQTLPKAVEFSERIKSTCIINK